MVIANRLRGRDAVPEQRSQMFDYRAPITQSLNEITYRLSSLNEPPQVVWVQGRRLALPDPIAQSNRPITQSPNAIPQSPNYPLTQ
jgi:hypothetical protein